MANDAVRISRYGQTPEGRPVRAFTLTNARGTEVRFIEYGGIILSIKLQGTNVVLALPSLADYVKDKVSVGALIGRYANRIKHGRFALNGRTYQLSGFLHGGARGFNKVVWHAEEFHSPGEAGAVLKHTSPAGDQGYPGHLVSRVRYTLRDDDSLSFDFHATTDAPTHVNFTQHSYFNLAGPGGGGGGDILDHELQLHAAHYLPLDEDLVPTGEVRAVQGTPYDFRTPTAIGARQNGDYDLNWVIERDGPGLVPAAKVHHPASGRTLEILTTQPGIQFYTGQRTALALEPQHFPDSPNRPEFPSTLLSPGEEYRAQIVYRFASST